VNRPPLVFLDANILFSATIGGPLFELLLDLAAEGEIRLLTSQFCIVEAETNLERKRIEARWRLAEVLTLTSIGAWDGSQHMDWATDLVHIDDVHVLAAAKAAEADIFLTGDTTHFGPLMERTDVGMRVMTPWAFVDTQEPEAG
jgi:uncharacterized protein